MTAGFSWHEKRGLPFFIAKTWFGRYHSDNYNLTKKSWRMPRHVSSIYQVSPPLCRNETYLFFSLQNILIVEEQLIHSALCQTIYNIHDQNVRVILLNFFHIKCIWSFFWHFFLTGIPHLLLAKHTQWSEPSSVSWMPKSYLSSLFLCCWYRKMIKSSGRRRP